MKVLQDPPTSKKASLGYIQPPSGTTLQHVRHTEQFRHINKLDTPNSLNMATPPLPDHATSAPYSPHTRTGSPPGPSLRPSLPLTTASWPERLACFLLNYLQQYLHRPADGKFPPTEPSTAILWSEELPVTDLLIRSVGLDSKHFALHTISAICTVRRVWDPEAELFEYAVKFQVQALDKDSIVIQVPGLDGKRAMVVSLGFEVHFEKWEDENEDGEGKECFFKRFEWDDIVEYAGKLGKRKFNELGEERTVEDQREVAEEIKGAADAATAGNTEEI
ncbi:hypothetical protein B0J14DRAFT_594859, partial [Halenospora varia]